MRLRAQAEAIEGEIVAIAAERKALALPAVSGDKEAIKSLALLNSQHAKGRGMWLVGLEYSPAAWPSVRAAVAAGAGLSIGGSAVRAAA